jgi:putative pyruvate formate lyase activating enzyme
MKYPRYLNLSSQEIEEKITQANKLLEFCRVCPRHCGANRAQGEKGYCYLGKNPVIFKSHSDFEMEDFLVGKNGSGAIDFNYCNLSCVFCRSFEISQLERGRKVPQKEIDSKGLAKMMIDLQKKGCHNIDLINPTSQVPQILQALPLAIKQGLKIPLVYNTNAYDSVETLKLLEGVIDIYLPDLKYSDDKIAEKYSHVPKYFYFAQKAVKEMYRQVGNLKFDENGMVKSGLLVRHLILPNNISGAEKVFKFLKKEISPQVKINIMNRYTPCWHAKDYHKINRLITTQEYEQAIQLAKKYELNWFTE